MIYEKVNLLTKKECESICSYLEEHKDKFVMGNANGETKYAAYESDLTIEFPKIHNFLKDKIEKKDIFLINKCKVIKSFACRYSVDTSPSMPYHYDVDNYTILLYLNDDFKGGGTHFPLLNKTFSVKEYGIGNALLFSGDKIKSWHGAVPIDDGVRYTVSIRISKEKTINLLFKSFIFFIINPILTVYMNIYNKKNRK
jgi:hypothetical protein